MASLIFIDTNIYLDFYRFSGTDTNLSILQHLESNHDRIITTSEVEMEYKKNRQNVILQSLTTLKTFGSDSLVVPAFLKESKTHISLVKLQKSLVHQTNKLKERTAKLLESPGRNDPVYKVLQRLFRARGFCHLTRENRNKIAIRREATQRFLLGYPPRKPNDFSMVDAINWEWIIHCAQNSTNDTIIVSRDSDYGRVYQNKPILNDWLLHEFKERVSHKRSIILTNSLTKAFKLATIPVSKEEEKFEQELLETKRFEVDSIQRFPNFDPTWSSDIKNKWFNEFAHLVMKLTIEKKSLMNQQVKSLHKRDS